MGSNRFLCAIVVTLLIAGCGSAGPAMEISNAWSPVAPPGAAVVAAYVDIAAGQADTLLDVHSPIAGSVELHESIEEGGVMKMRPVPQLALMKHQTVHMAPGGMHLMLMDVSQPLSAGASIPLIFHFAVAGDVAVTATVKPRP